MGEQIIFLIQLTLRQTVDYPSKQAKEKGLKQILLSSPHRNYYYYYYYFCHIVQFVEIPQPGITLGIPVHHQLPELAQTPVHGVGDAIQPSHSLSTPSPPALNLFQHQSLSNELALHIRWPKYWSFSFNISPTNEHPALISFRMDWLDLLAVQGTLKSLLQPQFKSINFLVLSFLYSPTLTSIHDHWKNHSLD